MMMDEDHYDGVRLLLLDTRADLPAHPRIQVLCHVGAVVLLRVLVLLLLLLLLVLVSECGVM